MPSPKAEAKPRLRICAPGLARLVTVRSRLAPRAAPTSRPDVRFQANTESPIIKISPPERGASGVQAASVMIRIGIANKRIKPPVSGIQDAVACAEVNQHGLNPPAPKRMLRSNRQGGYPWTTRPVSNWKPPHFAPCVSI